MHFRQTLHKEVIWINYVVMDVSAKPGDEGEGDVIDDFDAENNAWMFFLLF